MSRPLLLIVLAACTTEGTQGIDDPIVRDFVARPGVEQITVLDARPSAELTLLNPDGEPLVTVIADDAGQAHFAYVPSEPITLTGSQDSLDAIISGSVLRAGDGYVIVDETGLTSGPLTVLDVGDVLAPEGYAGQILDGIHSSPLSGDEGDPMDGFNYIRMRDGVTLSAMVRFPDAFLYGEGPYPTVIEYSGYSPSKPSNPDAGARIANALGYATVSVNMRGTGCSGGVFDVFNKAQQADGYDIVEVVARQEWVLNNHVAMLGLSYSGIAALYTASAQPPSLAAAVPMSVIGDPWEMQWPGGIYNQGFTRSWVENRESQAAANGSSWVVELIEQGEETCRDNVALSHLSIDFESFLAALEYRHPLIDERDLNTLIRNVDAPLFLAGVFQDEQTGAQFGAMMDHLDNSPNSKVFLSNGRHPDGYSPEMVVRWFEFLEFYVAERIPELNPLLRSVGSDTFAEEFHFTDYDFPDDRFTDSPSFTAALAAYEAEPQVRVQFESGAGIPGQPGAPIERFSTQLDSWPAPNAVAITWHLDAEGSLSSTAPSSDAADAWRWDEQAGTTVFFGARGYQLMARQWDLDWTRFADGDAASYLTAPFADDAVIAGPGIAELWINSPEDDVRVQVTLTEVRPDGNEVYLTSGWLRVGHRAATSGDDLRIERTYAREDFAPVPVDEWVRADVQIPSLAHPIRAGSQLRMVVSTPGRDHGTWEFESPDYATPPTFLLGRGGAHASNLTLATLPGIAVPAGLPECNALRGQPCRAYVPMVNTAAGE